MGQNCVPPSHPNLFLPLASKSPNFCCTPKSADVAWLSSTSPICWCFVFTWSSISQAILGLAENRILPMPTDYHDVPHSNGCLWVSTIFSCHAVVEKAMPLRCFWVPSHFGRCQGPGWDHWICGEWRARHDSRIGCRAPLQKKHMNVGEKYKPSPIFHHFYRWYNPFPNWWFMALFFHVPGIGDGGTG